MKGLEVHILQAVETVRRAFIYKYLIFQFQSHLYYCWICCIHRQNFGENNMIPCQKGFGILHNKLKIYYCFLFILTQPDGLVYNLLFPSVCLCVYVFSSSTVCNTLYILHLSLTVCKCVNMPWFAPEYSEY